MLQHRNKDLLLQSPLLGHIHVHAPLHIYAKHKLLLVSYLL